MLTAMTAVDNILAGRTDKTNIWNVNTEKEYHEEVEKHQGPPQKRSSAAPAVPAEHVDRVESVFASR